MDRVSFRLLDNAMDGSGACTYLTRLLNVGQSFRIFDSISQNTRNTCALVVISGIKTFKRGPEKSLGSEDEE